MYQSGKDQVSVMGKSKLSVDFGSKRIDFQLSYDDRKTLGIKVYPDGSIHAIAPIGISEPDVLKKMASKGSWILKQQANFLSYHPLTPPRKYVNGETHLYLGRQYKLRSIEADKAFIKLYRGNIIMYSPDLSSESLHHHLQTWYKERAKIHFKEMVLSSLPKFDKYKISLPELSIRTMTKRWGSCTPSGKIILNTELIKAPKGSIEYVVIHELCHLVHPNHTKAFFNLQERIMPDWKKWKDRLEYSLA